MSKKVLASLLAVILISVAQAQDSDSDSQVRYVTDLLRLSLYDQADSQSKVIQLLGSGDKLTVEEIAGPYAKVTTSAGNRGWVKRGFLVSEPTAGLLVDEFEKKNELLKQELEKLNDSKVVLDQYEKDMDSMNDKIALLENEKQKAEQIIVGLEKAAEEKQQQEKARPALASLIKIGTVYWQYIALIILFIIIVGFFIGKQVTEASVKRKFHGIKVW